MLSYGDISYGDGLIGFTILYATMHQLAQDTTLAISEDVATIYDN